MIIVVQVEEQLSTELPESEETPYLVRMSWSPLEGSMIAGEGRSSYAYESSGVKVNNRNREDFGEGYTVGDTITCYIVRGKISHTCIYTYMQLFRRFKLFFFNVCVQNLTGDTKTVSFSKNGEEPKEAFTISDSTERLFFPHVTSKNVRVSFNFGGQPPTNPPPEGYSFIQEAAEEDRDYAVAAATSKGDCEVILTVGLPASGKTYWASRQLSKYPEKRYTVIGTSQLVDRMAVSIHTL